MSWVCASEALKIDGVRGPNHLSVVGSVRPGVIRLAKFHGYGTRLPLPAIRIVDDQAEVASAKVEVLRVETLGPIRVQVERSDVVPGLPLGAIGLHGGEELVTVVIDQLVVR